MKNILTLILLALAVESCAPKAIIVEPIAPAVVKAAGDVRAAAVGAKRVQAKVVTVHEQSKGIAAEADRMKVETDRLRNLPGVPLAEFDALWQMVTDHQRETFAHEIQAREAVAVADEGEKLNVAAESSTAALEPLAKKTDAAVVELKTEVVKQTADADFGRAIKRVFWMAVGVAIIGGIAILILKFG